LLTLVRSDLIAVRRKQFRAFFADVAPGRSGPGGATLLGGAGSSAAPMNGHPHSCHLTTNRDVEILTVMHAHQQWPQVL